ncbi:MAG: UvrD-helicase domain-containing protein [Bacillota bacterium]|nr:UvrD-helicase domain-containing protein [Bacillota bacterium]
MSIAWNEEQEAALEAAGKVLVSASAGCGKTTVLTERVLRWLLAGGSLESLIVVTFTEEAAAEMRSRIRGALEREVERNPANRFLRHQLQLLPQARISTLHAFCLRLIKRHFRQLRLDPSARVLAQEEQDLLLEEALDLVLDRHYQEEDPRFVDLVESYGTADGGDGPIREILLELHATAYARPWPEIWLQEALATYRQVRQDPQGSPVYRLLLDDGRLHVEEALAWLERGLWEARDGSIKDLFEADQERIRQALALWEKDPFGALQAMQFWPQASWKDTEEEETRLKRLQGYRQKAKDALKEVASWLTEDLAERWRQEADQFLPLAAKMVALVEELEETYRRLKEEEGLLDFSDMERLTLRLLQDPAAPPGTLRPSPQGLEIRKTCQALLVDEFQDINELQHAILTLLGGEEVFYVGDVKQSIYRFRQAEPQLFLNLYAGYRDRGGGALVHLRTNYRSHPAVIGAVNHVFRRLMREELGGLSYTEEAALVAGRESIAGKEKGAHLFILHHPRRREWEALAPDEIRERRWEREARFVAQKVAELLQDPHLWILDPGTGERRHPRPGDVAILLRSARSRAPLLREALLQRGISSVAAVGGGFLHALEVRWVLHLLQVLDNPRQDIPLASLMRSPLGGFSLEELLRIRSLERKKDLLDAVFEAQAQGDELGAKTKAFWSRVEAWRTRVRRRPLLTFLEELYGETHLLDVAEALPGGSQRRANLEALLERARQFEHFARQGLGSFLEFLRRLEEKGEDFAVAPPSRGDAVRILTIHQSKGLEFPIVVVAGLGQPFRGTREAMVVERELGIAFKSADPQLRVRAPSLFYRAFLAHRRRQELAEEMRILYVALTRARDSLVLVGSTEQLEEDIPAESLWDWEETLSLGRLLLASDYLAWVRGALQKASPFWEVTVLKPGEEGSAREARSDEAPAEVSADGEGESFLDAIQEKWNWVYPYREDTEALGKRAASEMRLPLDPEVASAPLPSYLRPLHSPSLDGQGSLRGAQRGSAFHLVMQKLPWEAPLEEGNVTGILQELGGRGLLPPGWEEEITPEEILGFFRTDVGQKLFHAVQEGARMRREWLFTWRFPRTRGDFLLVQGVVDLMVEMPEGFYLVDYKTDQVKDQVPKPLLEQYESQVKVYRQAIQAITGKAVAGAYLYFTRPQLLLPVT